jgi:hypothetical protein
MLSLLGEKAFLVSHSLGSRNPLLLSNDCPEYIAGSINLEAATSPFWSYAEGLGGYAGSPWGLTNTPVTYDPPVSDPSGKSTHPILFLSRCSLTARSSRAQARICWK